MHMQFVDLYQFFGATKPEAGKGTLKCLDIPTSEKVSPCRKKPAVLIIPGGGYSHVSPREAEPVALRFLAKGYAAFILDYAVAPAVFPTALREAAMAMRYIRLHASVFGVDSAMVAAVGFSAGGHLCGSLGTMYDAPELADIGTALLLRPDALGLCYPVTVGWGATHEGTFENISGGNPDLRARLSLERHVRADMPPVFLWHTRDDGAVPCRNSLIFASALDEAGVDFALHIYRSGPHGLSTADNMAYPDGAVPAMSGSVPGWIDELIGFFAEKGLKIRDFEVEK